MTDDIPERVARLETWSTGHEDQCKERYQQIKSDTAEIKGVLVSMSSELKNAVARIHDRIDSEAQTARNATSAVDGKVSGHKIWLLSSAVAIAGSIIVFLIDKVWPK